MTSSQANIVLFVCDDLRFDALGCMGDAVVQTPHLDRLAADGVHYTRCYMPGGTSPAVCMPSRAMLHTGRSLFQMSNEGQDIDPGHVLLGEHLQAHGYHAFHTGKWHNERASLARSFNDGDAIFLGGMGDPWKLPLTAFDPSGVYANERVPAPDDLQRHSTTRFVDAARTFVDRNDRDQPFFLSIALTAPHDPRSAPKAFHDLYPAAEMALPENFLAQHPHDTGFMSRIGPDGVTISARDEDLAALPRHPAEIRQHIADYYAMITHLDAEFGRLREALESKGVWDETIVVFTSDHGLAVGQHGLMGKQSLYDHSLRVPLIMSGPGLPAGTRCDQLVCHYDLFRTLCELAAVPVPPSVQGESLMAALGATAPRDELYLAYGTSIRGLLQNGWKLIEYAGPQGYRATQLFDLRSDPLERLDRSRDPEAQQLLTRLLQRLLELSVSSGDRDHRIGRQYWAHREASA
ncbi:MAG: sulfatase-like hydrolase/transferase [Verrucomicrobia bacterium]|nr:sulfatase-like hydrolase/transferase [Verrucomicrobiota bacterium]